MSDYCQNDFFYESAKIRHLNGWCYRYGGFRLWNNEDTTDDYGEDRKVTSDRPPLSNYDIALLQVTLSDTISLVNIELPTVASVAVDWKSDKGDFTHHVVRFDLEETMIRPSSSEELRKSELASVNFHHFQNTLVKRHINRVVLVN